MLSNQNEYKVNHNNDSSNGSNSCCHPSTTTTATNVSNFPAKLHFMLNELQRDGLEYIASWQQHGRCFIVRNPKEFESKILPCYFQQSKFTSFQRQLSFYGFRRINSGRDKGGYFHEHFLRGKEELAVKVIRTKVKGTGPRKPNSMESPTPNFYEMVSLQDNTNTKNSNHYVNKKEFSHTVKDTNDYIPHGPSMKTFEANIPEDIVSSSPVCTVDEKSMLWKRNQERMHQLELLNGIDRDMILLSRASYNIQKYVQAQKSCRVKYHGMSSSSSSSVVSSCNNNSTQSSFVGLNYPLATSSRIIPSSSYNQADMIRAALTKYYQQQQRSNN